MSLVWGLLLNMIADFKPGKINLESRAAGVLERFDRMKVDINEWKTSAESQFISMDAINDKAKQNHPKI